MPAAVMAVLDLAAAAAVAGVLLVLGWLIGDRHALRRTRPRR